MNSYQSKILLNGISKSYDGMKILVIPDVHLKPQMFKQATALMHQGIADRAVCLMDIPDDWDK